MGVRAGRGREGGTRPYLGGEEGNLKNKALLPGVGPTNRNISPTPGSRPGAWTPNERISIRIVYIRSNLKIQPLYLYII